MKLSCSNSLILVLVGLGSQCQAFSPHSHRRWKSVREVSAVQYERSVVVKPCRNANYVLYSSSIEEETDTLADIYTTPVGSTKEEQDRKDAGSVSSEFVLDQLDDESLNLATKTSKQQHSSDYVTESSLPTMKSSRSTDPPPLTPQQKQNNLRRATIGRQDLSILPSFDPHGSSSASPRRVSQRAKVPWHQQGQPRHNYMQPSSTRQLTAYRPPAPENYMNEGLQVRPYQQMYQGGGSRPLKQDGSIMPGFNPHAHSPVTWAREQRMNRHQPHVHPATSLESQELKRDPCAMGGFYPHTASPYRRAPSRRLSPPMLPASGSPQRMGQLNKRQQLPRGPAMAGRMPSAANRNQSKQRPRMQPPSVNRDNSSMRDVSSMPQFDPHSQSPSQQQFGAYPQQEEYQYNEGVSPGDYIVHNIADMPRMNPHGYVSSSFQYNGRRR